MRKPNKMRTARTKNTKEETANINDQVLYEVQTVKMFKMFKMIKKTKSSKMNLRIKTIKTN